MIHDCIACETAYILIMTEKAVVVQESEKSDTPVKDVAESEPVRETEGNEVNEHSENRDRKKYILLTQKKEEAQKTCA